MLTAWPQVTKRFTDALVVALSHDLVQYEVASRMAVSMGYSGTKYYINMCVISRIFFSGFYGHAGTLGFTICLFLTNDLCDAIGKALWRDKLPP